MEAIERADGELSLRVRGMEFARTADEELLLRVGAAPQRRVRRKRPRSGGWRKNSPAPFARRCATVRIRCTCEIRRRGSNRKCAKQIEAIDARLLRTPVYGQVPAFAATDRGVLDLLAVDRSGRLAVLELKASEDIHLPLQALDYWMRVKWHLDRREFSAHGYFPGMELRAEPPRLLLVSPALDFHPSNERVLRYISPGIEVERVGVSLEWQKELKVMFRS